MQNWTLREQSFISMQEVPMAFGKKVLSSLPATWGNSGSTLTREQKISKLHLYFQQKPAKKDTQTRWAAAFWRGWCSLHKNVTAASRHSKCQGQDQDSSHEDALDLLNNQRWEKHQKKVYDQEKVKSSPNPPTQPTTCGQQAAAGSSPPSPCTWAMLELRELLLVNEPTAFRNFAPWQQLGTKSLNRSSSHCGYLGLGCPARSLPARQCGAPCAKTGGRRQSHHYSCGTIYFKEIIRDFQDPCSGATVEGHQEPLCRTVLLAKPPVKLQPQEFNLNAAELMSSF